MDQVRENDRLRCRRDAGDRKIECIGHGFAVSLPGLEKATFAIPTESSGILKSRVLAQQGFGKGPAGGFVDAAGSSE
jgi:hypothetical protein